MAPMHAIRLLLGLSQAEIAEALGCTQPNVFKYERRGQSVPPDVAASVIKLAKGRGYAITYDHVYGAAEVPRVRIHRAADRVGA